MIEVPRAAITQMIRHSEKVMPLFQPVEEFIKRIEAEKKQLIKEKKIKKENPLPAISENEVPYELPEGWQATALAGRVILYRETDDHYPGEVIASNPDDNAAIDRMET